MAYEAELKVAVEAVREAAILCRAVQGRLRPDLEMAKQDRSPVTVADFGAQALICRRLEQAFLDDRVIGEESADALREPDNASLKEEVTAEVRAVLGDVTSEQVCAWIDRGGARDHSPRYWTLDPIDGTKGFLRGAHYAIALALVVDGKLSVGVVAGPNLDGGVLFSASAGGGAFVRPLDVAGTDDPQAIAVSATESTAAMRWCESVESAHQSHRISARIAEALGTNVAPRRIDSMLKYGLVARADAELYLRLPKQEGYQEKIWDHAAGAIVVLEAGGRVTDLKGDALDFGNGSRLGNDAGIIVSNGRAHDRILEVVNRVRSESP
jgi:3'(2'), 5'-bisphosphate nucleotidase